MNESSSENDDSCCDVDMEDYQSGANATNFPQLNTDKLPMPVYEKGRFDNPWKTEKQEKCSHLFRLLHCIKERKKPPHKKELDKKLPVFKPNVEDFAYSPVSGVRVLWLGHSTLLVQFDGITILTDPMFSQKFSSTERYRPVPCTIDELPAVHCILISHSHLDHLDQHSVVALNERFGDSVCWYVPMELKKWMNYCGCNRVVELTWWQEDVLHDDLNVRVTCTPCHHWSKRTANDINKVLWCSWCVIGPKHSFFFCGDTAYCDVFKLIGERLGPFTLAALPIGAYSPRKLLSKMHIDPVQAVNIHEDLKSETSIGIHWGTFPMTSEPYLEPRKILKNEILQRNMNPSQFFTLKHGEVLLIGSDHLNDLD